MNKSLIAYKNCPKMCTGNSKTNTRNQKPPQKRAENPPKQTQNVKSEPKRTPKYTQGSQNSSKTYQQTLRSALKHTQGPPPEHPKALTGV